MHTLHCQFCGVSFGAQTAWPRTCEACKQTTFRNPIPVGVLLQPVRSNHREGLLVIRRGIEPARGKLALPGGYIEEGEDWKEGVCREAWEEMGVKTNPSHIQLFDVQSNSKKDRILLFGLAFALEESQLPLFEPTSETTERKVIWGPEELAFPLHTEVATRYFTQRV